MLAVETPITGRSDGLEETQTDATIVCKLIPTALFALPLPNPSSSHLPTHLIGLSSFGVEPKRNGKRCNATVDGGSATYYLGRYALQTKLTARALLPIQTYLQL